jgi:hypothetical protein
MNRDAVNATLFGTNAARDGLARILAATQINFADGLALWLVRDFISRLHFAAASFLSSGLMILILCCSKNSCGGSEPIMAKI